MRHTKKTHYRNFTHHSLLLQQPSIKKGNLGLRYTFITCTNISVHWFWPYTVMQRRHSHTAPSDPWNCVPNSLSLSRYEATGPRLQQRLCSTSRRRTKPFPFHKASSGLDDVTRVSYHRSFFWQRITSSVWNSTNNRTIKYYLFRSYFDMEAPYNWQRKKGASGQGFSSITEVFKKSVLLQKYLKF
jgi:hypothetical protein